MTLDFYLAWLVILALLVSFAVALIPPKPKKSKRELLTRRDESWMGRHVKDHKRRTTIHTIINRLAGEATPTKAVMSFVQREEFPDISFYQGDIDWEKMASKTKKVIIRSGQNLWEDVKFRVNYAAAKLFGLLRGIYHFYDGRVSPGAQAALVYRLVKDDRPELGIWIDWERSYKGSHEGLKNVVAMMQELERLLPGVEIGMYSGYWFFRENSNPIWNAAQYAYLAKKRLWLAFYALLELVLIPAPWFKMAYWQKGTPSRGAEFGVETIEIDMNEDMEASDAPPPPPPVEEPMIATYRITTDIATERTAPVIADNKTGKIYVRGDIVNVVDTIGSSVEKWAKLDNGNFICIALNGVVRAEPVQPAPQPSAVGRVVAVIDVKMYDKDGNLTGKYYQAVDEPIEGVG